jgi:hypothetical protein
LCHALIPFSSRPRGREYASFVGRSYRLGFRRSAHS